MLGFSKVEKIKKANPVAEFIQDHGVQLKKEGSSYVGKCPFHEDDKPSLRVTPDKGLWNCFGCDKGGDVISFYQYLKGLDNKQAIAELYQLENHDIKSIVQPTPAPSLPQKPSAPETPTKSASTSTPKPTDQATLKRVLKDVTRLYVSSLTAHSTAQDYLKGRGLVTPEVWERYHLGYCDGQKLKRFAENDDTLKVQLQELGLLNEAENESFYKCIIFPLLNLRGEIVGLYGRSIEGKRHAYTKGKRTGLFNAGACKKMERVILVESIIDALSLIELGFMNVMPLYGVQGYTDELDRFLMGMTLDEIILMLDNDETGKAKTEELVKLLSSKGVMVSQMNLDDGWKDINEMLQAGATTEDVQKLLEHRKNFALETPRKEAPMIPDDSGDKLLTECLKEDSEGLKERTKDQLTFVYGELEYRLRGHGETQANAKVVLCVIKGDRKHIDRVDLYSDRQRRSFSSAVAHRCDVQPSKIEDDLLNIIMDLEGLTASESSESTEEPAHSMTAAERNGSDQPMT